MIAPYRICCMQADIRSISRPDEYRDVLAENLARAAASAEEAVLRDEARVVVFPQYVLQGFEPGRSAEAWLELGVEIPGPETRYLGDLASRTGVYLAGAVLERDPVWPGRLFNTAFIIGPDGEVILRYRQLNADWGLPVTTPGDVYGEYLRRSGGPESLFPVVDTPLGRLGCLIGGDVNYFELSRCLTYRGAEVLLHPTSEPHGEQSAGWEQARRTRAYENVVYLASANHATISRSRGPSFHSRGHSEIVDFGGSVLAELECGGEALISATVDLEALRYRRGQVRFNLPAQVKTGLFAPVYRQAQAYPADVFVERPPRDVDEERQVLLDTIARYQRTGRYVQSELYREMEEARES